MPISLHSGEPSPPNPQVSWWISCRQPCIATKNSLWWEKLTAAAIHEINNPAEAVTNLAYLILQHPGDPGLVAAFATQIEEQMLRIQYATRQTLSYFRETPQRQKVDLVSVVEAALRFHYPLLSQRNIHVRKQLPGELIADIFPGDFLQCYRI